LPWEKAASWKKAPQDPATASKDSNGLYRGIGCALVTDALFSSSDLGLAEDLPGFLGEAKSILLRVASNIPDSLKLTGKAAGECDPLADHRIWDRPHYFKVWRRFVLDVYNASMLAQSFTVLLASIDRKKLPWWWRNESAGWSTAQLVLACPSLSTLLLHLYVLDVAIAEFIASTCLKTSTPKRRISGSVKNRMGKYLKLANDLGFERFDGTHEIFCCFCDDGGSLLCCELCKNVQHKNCCDPPIERMDELDCWICDSCINDIKSAKETKAASG
jgi:hypothetical protein